MSLKHSSATATTIRTEKRKENSVDVNTWSHKYRVHK